MSTFGTATVKFPSAILISRNKITVLTSVPKALVSIWSLEMPTIEMPKSGRFGDGIGLRNQTMSMTTILYISAQSKCLKLRIPITSSMKKFSLKTALQRW